MEEGSLRALRMVAAVLVALIAVVSPCRAVTKEAETWALLKAADVRPGKGGKARIWQAGEIATGVRVFEIWRYQWVQDRKHMPGKAQHVRDWLFVVERNDKGRSLLGGYRVDGSAIRIKGRVIEFDDDTSYAPGVRIPRYQIVFTPKGPPSHVFLSDGHQKFNAAANHMGIWRILDDGYFSGEIDLDARVWRKGSISIGGKRYDIWGYAWEEEPRASSYPPRHIHKSYKVLVFERASRRLSYLGSYDRDNVDFRIEGQTIKFDLPKSGRPPGYVMDDPGGGIVFGKNGPPAEARVNWVVRSFRK